MTTTLPETLRFESTDLRVIDHHGRPWLTGADLARALEYQETDAVSRIYRRNAPEFTADMTETVRLTASGNLQTNTRIYSPRGCHLVAMLARTPKAKAFRRWVLDVLEGLEAQSGRPQAPAVAPRRKSLPAPTPTIANLLAERDRLAGVVQMARTEMERVVRAVAARPGLTSAEVSMLSQVNRRSVARQLVAAEQDGVLSKAKSRRCAVTNRKAFTWEAGEGQAPILPAPCAAPSGPDYEFERFVRSCSLGKGLHLVPQGTEAEV